MPEFRGEAGKIFYECVPYISGKYGGLDIGCGAWALPRSVAIDNNQDAELIAEHGTAAKVGVDARKLDMFASNYFSYVFSSHLLHQFTADEWPKVLAEWWRLVRPGGYLILYLPDPDLEAQRSPTGVANASRLYRKAVKIVMDQMRQGWELVRDELRDSKTNGWGVESSYFLVYRKRKDSKKIPLAPRPEGETSVCVVRYGGIGDMLVCSSIFPGLKQTFDRLVLVTQKFGESVLRHNPFVDEIIVEQKIVPDDELFDYWDHIKFEQGFDHVIVLKDTFEDLCLAKHGTARHKYWPASARRTYMEAINYLEAVHIMAEVPFPPDTRFYATPSEIRKAEKAKAAVTKNGKFKLVVWGLAGSGKHKTLPHTLEGIVDLIYKHEDLVVMTFGGPTEKREIEDHLPDHERFFKRAGEPLRDALTMATVADVVVAPETGLLHACAMHEVPKVVFMSHTGPDMLAKYWLNTVCVEPDPEIAPCAPCYKLAWNLEGCKLYEHPKLKAKVPACAGAISADMMVSGIERALGRYQAPKEEEVA